jgi:hypothetical protein
MHYESKGGHSGMKGLKLKKGVHTNLYAPP